ncbi:Fic family protein [Arthrobacter sp. ISL-95]|uniref:Fic family protein n=1 Tax=Arthrobacter sp. ISL-95 TaxID=2819116 RepID=UPI001BE9AFF2|nr:Fic family protein [Arthrobacter sp. ISL-95]MBT2585233.1 Fic family protein [Arthrobacter sp. ISL-95]
MNPLDFPEFPFSSPLAKAIIDLERVRADLGEGTTAPEVFTQLRTLFQLLSSIMSARIEGNRTSIVDAVAGVQLADRADIKRDDGVQEIVQLQEATAFVDSAVGRGTILTHGFVRELHRISVAGLEREGDRTPGAYRLADVTISGSSHRPPSPGSVHGDMTALLDFINADVDQNYELLKIALAHHRFVWIHPFGNGNGRVGRLMTYAAMRRQGFSDTAGYRALNPTAVFGENRALYYERLEDADSLEPESLIRWSTYVLEGLLTDLRRLAKLGDKDFVTEGLLVPAIARGLASSRFTADEALALTIIARKVDVKAADLSSAFAGSAATRSQDIRKLLDRGVIEPIAKGKRSYRLRLAPSELTPLLVRELDQLGFLPRILRDSE